MGDQSKPPGACKTMTLHVPDVVILSFSYFDFEVTAPANCQASPSCTRMTRLLGSMCCEKYCPNAELARIDWFML